MEFRVYILPMITVVGDYPGGSLKLPAYVDDIMADDIKIQVQSYGSENTCICRVLEQTDAHHNSIVANADAMALPQNLNQNMGNNAVDTARTYLENLNIPAGWINTNRTYIDVIKILYGLFQFNQKWSLFTSPIHSSPFKDGLNLETEYKDMTNNAKSRLRACFDDLGVDYSMLTDTSTIREALYEFGNQMKDRVIL